MDEHRPLASFATTDDVDRSVGVNVDKNRVFGRTNVSNRHRRPRPFTFFRSGIEADANFLSLFPAGRDVQQAVGVHI